MSAPGIDRGGKLAEVDHGAAVAEQRNRLGGLAGERRADRHRNALPDPAAERMHAEMRRGQVHIAVAEGAVRQRDVAHEGMRPARHAREQRIGDDAIRTERTPPACARIEHAPPEYPAGIWRRHRAVSAGVSASRRQRLRGVGVDEQIDRIIAAACEASASICTSGCGRRVMLLRVSLPRSRDPTTIMRSARSNRSPAPPASCCRRRAYADAPPAPPHGRWCW